MESIEEEKDLSANIIMDANSRTSFLPYLLLGSNDGTLPSAHSRLLSGTLNFQVI
jgi:hypothetical protein